MRQTPRAFTLIELLVTVTIIAILMGALLPVLSRGRAMGALAACTSNLRQLHQANTLYAQEHHNHYVAAAPDIFGANRVRWHGTRAGAGSAFEASSGLLAPYLGSSSAVRRCPSLREVETSVAANAFESSCGGYGYNSVGVGSQIYRVGYSADGMARGMSYLDIKDPARTIMFTDCAFPQPYGSPEYLIEYSFAEPYYWVFAAGEVSSSRANPSIHFRHRGRANVAWCDGHVTQERLETTGASQFTEWDIGWFGPADNSLFDPE